MDRDRHGKRLGHPLAAFDVRSRDNLQVGSSASFSFLFFADLVPAETA